MLHQEQGYHRACGTKKKVDDDGYDKPESKVLPLESGTKLRQQRMKQVRMQRTMQPPWESVAPLQRELGAPERIERTGQDEIP
jgi:hypothetical protein